MIMILFAVHFKNLMLGLTTSERYGNLKRDSSQFIENNKMALGKCIKMCCNTEIPNQDKLLEDCLSYRLNSEFTAQSAPPISNLNPFSYNQLVLPNESGETSV